MEMTSPKKKPKPRATPAKPKPLNGKGDSPRNLSPKFRSNYKAINWSKKKS